MNGLPQFYHPVFETQGFERATDDRFLLVVEASDPKFDIEETPQAADRARRSTNGGGGEMKRSSLALPRHLLLAGCAASRRPAQYSGRRSITDMDYQGRYEPQGDRTFNGEQAYLLRTRAPAGVPSTAPSQSDRLPKTTSFYTGVANNMYIGRNPLKVDAELLQHGQRRFNTYCSPCHDRTGQGRGIVGQRATWIPTNLQEPRVKEMNDGEIFNVMTNGRRSMPPYRFQVVDHDRWAIVAYVRALQRTSTATVADVPEDQTAELK